MNLLVVLVFVALAAARPDYDYSRYENFNIDEITSNKRLLQAYCECFLGIRRCTAEGADFKKWIPEAIQDSCSKCSDHQKALVAKFIIAIQEQLPGHWEKLNKLYNPDGQYDVTLKEFLREHGD